VSRPQELQLELIRLASFNDFDGGRAVDDLLRSRELWTGVLMDAAGLVKLRDIGAGVWNVDTLYVLSSGTDDRALETLVRSWGPDSIGWIEGEAADRELGWSLSGLRVLSAWWD